MSWYNAPVRTSWLLAPDAVGGFGSKIGHLHGVLERSGHGLGHAT